MEKENFEKFHVYINKEYNCFIHININDSKLFYKEIFDYFFSENLLLKYIENKSSVHFEPTVIHYTTLYKKLSTFIDKENWESLSPNTEKDLLSIDPTEYTIIEENGIKKIRIDKIGKIGEYIFSNILSEYFGFQCIIPKLNLITDYNMNVFGIDTLFYCPKDKLILLGESKVCKNVYNGIQLINASLKNYQSQVDSEFELILSQRIYKEQFGKFGLDFGEKIEMSLSMSEFIKKADIKKICIPIFIAHGETTDVKEIFDEFSKTKKIGLYGIETKYIFISLPLIDKKEFANFITGELIKRKSFYESKRK